MKRPYRRHVRAVMNACVSSTVPAALAGILMLAGCSTKSTSSTTTGNEPGMSGTTALAQLPSGGAERGGGDRITGFSKTPADEPIAQPAAPRVAQPVPMVVAKADSSEAHAEAARGETARQLTDIYFAFDKWTLSAEGRKNLAESAALLKQHPGTMLTIEGHCDERGSRDYNLVLGEKRARETLRYLTALGVGNHAKIISYGKERPVCKESDESCYWKNRRGHLVLNDGK